jgi:hypothetical protein
MGLIPPPFSFKRRGDQRGDELNGRGAKARLLIMKIYWSDRVVRFKVQGF